MTKSELIARLATRYSQLVAKDAEFTVKMILDAMMQSLVKGQRIEIRGFGSFGLNHRPARVREGPRTREIRSAFQSRQGIARAGRSKIGAWAGGMRTAASTRCRRLLWSAWLAGC